MDSVVDRLVVFGLMFLGGLFMSYGVILMLGIITLVIFLEDPYTLAKRSLFKVVELLLAWE